MKEKRNIVLPVILIIIVLGLVGYILIDKQIIKIPGIAKENNTVEKEEKPKITEIDTDNASIKALITQVHNPSEQLDSLIYEKGGSKVEDMDEEYKFAIATNNKDINITSIPADAAGNVGYVDEEKVKEAYERLFGPGTYHEINNFKLGCADMSYDIENKRYVTKTDGCGISMTPITGYEEIISAQKDEDTLTIITTVAFHDASTGKLYKDMDLTKETPLTANTSLTEKEIREYILSYKEDLNQYTYTFDIGTDGFYYYTGVERTKE